MKRLINPSTYLVTTNKARYAVTLERLNNDRNGNPRFKGVIITLEYFGEIQSTETLYTVAYTFKGHYMSDSGEAAELVRRHEDLTNN